MTITSSARPCPGAQMPQDYGKRMSAGEFDDLVAFLLVTTRQR